MGEFDFSCLFKGVLLKHVFCSETKDEKFSDLFRSIFDMLIKEWIFGFFFFGVLHIPLKSQIFLSSIKVICGFEVILDKLIDFEFKCVFFSLFVLLFFIIFKKIQLLTQ